METRFTLSLLCKLLLLLLFITTWCILSKNLITFVTNVPHLISRCLVFGCEEFCCQFIRRCWSGFQLRSFNHLQGKTWLVKKFIDCDIFSWVERNLVTKKKNGPILKVVKKICLCTFVGIINKVVNVESLIFFCNEMHYCIWSICWRMFT